MLAALFLILLVVAGVVALILTSLFLVPVIMTPHAVVEEILDIMQLKKGQFLLELGAGDGRLLVQARKRKQIHGVGYEISPLVTLYAKLYKLVRLPFKRGIVVHTGNFLSSDFSIYDHIYAHLNTRALRPVYAKLVREMHPDARFYSYNVQLPHAHPSEVYPLSNGKELYVYMRENLVDLHADVENV